MDYPAEWLTENGHIMLVERYHFTPFYTRYTFVVFDNGGKKHLFELTENNDFPNPSVYRMLRHGSFDLFTTLVEMFDECEIEAYIEWGLKTNYLTLSTLSTATKKIYLMGECRLIYKCCPYAPWSNRLNIRNTNGHVVLEYIEKEHEYFWSYQNSLTILN